MLIISVKKSAFVLILFLIFMSSICIASANDDFNNGVSIDEGIIFENNYDADPIIGDDGDNKVYVNPSANLSVVPDGSRDKPYSSIGEAVDVVSDNSTIIMLLVI